MAGVGGAYLSVFYTPMWVEGMVAGRGWIALALVVFATWRPARVLVGAYLFGGVTIAQFFAQGAGAQIDIPSQFLSALPYLGDDRRAGHHLAQRQHDPSELAGVARAAVPSRCLSHRERVEFASRSADDAGHASRIRSATEAMDHRNRRFACRWRWVADCRRARRRPAGRCGASPQKPVKIGFVYVSPIGDAGLDVPARPGRKEMEKALGGKVRPSSSRTCPRAPTPSA